MKNKKTLLIVILCAVAAICAIVAICVFASKDQADQSSSSGGTSINVPGETPEVELERVTQSKLVTYEGPSILKSSEKVKVEVEDQEIFVYETRVNHDRMHGWAAPTTTNPVAIFDFCGEVNVQITVNDVASVTSAVVRPLAYSIEPQINGNVITFKLSQPVSYVVEYNGDSQNAIHLFTNLPETEEEKIDPENIPENTIYIGPGVYKADAIPVNKNNTTIYIAGGSVVYGNIRAEKVNGITVRGRGIIDGCIYPRTKDSEFTLPMEFRYCNDVEISGITVLDPAGWVLTLYHCEDVVINDVKMITARSNGDGISVQSCKDVTVSGGFVRGWDDALVVKNKDRGTTENITFRNVTVWTDLAQSMEIGYETDGQYIKNVLFEDITVLHNYHKPVMSIHNSDDAKISQIVFRNITVEDAQMQADTPNDTEDDFLIELLVAYHPTWSVTDARGSIENVLFDNVLVLNQKDGITSRFSGYAENATIRAVKLNNIKIENTKVYSANDMSLNTNTYVSGVEIGYSGETTGARLYKKYELDLAQDDSVQKTHVNAIAQEGVLVPEFSKIEQQDIFNGVKASGNFTVSATHGKGTKTTTSPDDGSGDWSKSGYTASALTDGNIQTEWVGKSEMVAQDEFIALNFIFDSPKTIGTVRIHTKGQYAQKYHMVAYNVSQKADGGYSYRLIGTFDFDLSPATGNYADIKIPTKEYFGLQFRLFNSQGLMYPTELSFTEFEFYPASLTFAKTVYASDYEDVYVANNAVDGNTSSYFETKKGIWPAYIAVDMGALYSIKYINIHLPPHMTWEARVQNIEIQISTDVLSSGMTIDQLNFTTLIEGKDYTFDPATGNVIALTLDQPVQARFIKLIYTSNSSLGGYGAQISELSVFEG